MTNKNGLVALIALAFGGTVAHADITTSYTGTLSSPEDTVEFVLNLASAGTVTLQTYGFGGGTNAAGAVISPGGTDPFLAIFSGTGDSAMIVTDGLANPYGTSLGVANYGNPDFVGCLLANTESISGSPVCGDITMTIPSLAVGTYTVILSDGEYQANAVVGYGGNGTLGEWFSDFTGDDPTTLPPTPGIFCNIEINGVACPNNSGAYALDITTPSGPAPVPEPSAVVLLGTFLLGLGALYGGGRQPRSR